MPAVIALLRAGASAQRMLVAEQLAERVSSIDIDFVDKNNDGRVCTHADTHVAIARSPNDLAILAGPRSGQ